MGIRDFFQKRIQKKITRRTQTYARYMATRQKYIFFGIKNKEISNLKDNCIAIALAEQFLAVKILIHKNT